MLQKRLEDDKQHSDFKAALVQSVSPFFADLMVDQFGNYLSQKIFEVATHDELRIIIDSINPCLVQISVNVHGTRAVQTLIEVLSKNTKATEPLLQSLISFLRPNIKILSLVTLNNILNNTYRMPMGTMWYKVSSASSKPLRTQMSQIAKEVSVLNDSLSSFSRHALKIVLKSALINMGAVLCSDASRKDGKDRNCPLQMSSFTTYMVLLKTPMEITWSKTFSSLITLHAMIKYSEWLLQTLFAWASSSFLQMWLRSVWRASWIVRLLTRS